MRQKFLKCLPILLLIAFTINLGSLALQFPESESSMIANREIPTGLKINNISDASDLRVGTGFGLHDLDPVNAWDSGSNNVIRQVAEGLFSYNYSDYALPRINRLAENYWWENDTILHIKLRDGILFHDGTPFNASVAKWNLDRLNYLANTTGERTDSVPQAQTSYLWMLPNNDPIINRVEISGIYNITIHLNEEFSPFLDLLCYTNAYMLSPSSTPADDYLDLTTGDLVGTGPFTYDSFTPNVDIRFSRWNGYWREPSYFETLTFNIIEDATARTNAFAAGDIDYIIGCLTSRYEEFDANPEITVKYLTQETGLASLIYQYLGVNNNKFNVTWRKVMAYAFNYTYMLDEMLEGTLGTRAYSPISPGFGPDIYNSSVRFPIYDLAQARQILIDAGIAPASFGANNDPTDVDWLNANLLTVNYTGNIGNSFREDLLVVLQEWYSYIGINVVDNLITWDSYLDILLTPSRYDELELYFIGWAPDYKSAWNMMDPLFNPASASNSAQVDDPYLTAELAAIVAENDPVARSAMIKNLQYYIAKKQFHIYAYHPTITNVHRTDLKGVAYNSLEHFLAYPIYRSAPDSFSLTTDAGEPDDDGEFTLIWESADDATNYSVYQYSNFINEINESVNLLVSQITKLNLTLDDYEFGNYYFVVVAHNEYGSTISNCIMVSVDLVFEHNIALTLETPLYCDIGKTYTINASIENKGQNNESNIEFYLKINEEIVESNTIPTLSVENIETVYYDWTPSDYGEYNISAFVNAVPQETYLDDNQVSRLIDIIEIPIFDGLYITINYTMGSNSVLMNITYDKITNHLFNESWVPEEYSKITWNVDVLTRIMIGSPFGENLHTISWIPTDSTIGDIIPIAVMSEDHDFQITGDLIYNLTGFGLVELWILEDLQNPQNIAWYEKSTGIIIYYDIYTSGGMYNLSYQFLDTNANFSYYQALGSFSLSSDAESPKDVDGQFNLSWTPSENADNYSLYRHSSYIIEINQSITLLDANLTSLNYLLSEYSDGNYYFIVAANNEYDQKLSNCLRVSVGIPPGDFNLSSTADDPDPDGNFLFTWTASDKADKYSIFRSLNFISEFNATLTLIENDIYVLSYAINGHEEGIFYFVIVAQNEYGSRISNCVKLVVERPDPTNIPGYNNLIFILVIGASIVILIMRKKKINHK
ncbi:MAG: hypothetical protein GF317_18680 [Candidatus Lokiarchaeota archaeon]|nr:hypothetical protein [Candidatus Lokiarchaeota archaeon]MBD3201543.1 hypothetical protein [Candidatus Lokiarchaeota archaeon]